MPEITNAHDDIMRHSLGHTGYRNRFCAGQGHVDMPLLKDLCEAGLMAVGGTINKGTSTLYYVTEAGQARVGIKESD